MKRSWWAAAAVFAAGAVLATSALSQPPAGAGGPGAGAPGAGRGGAAGAPGGRGGAGGRGGGAPNPQAVQNAAGEVVFDAKCKNCHEPAVADAAAERAPSRAQLAALWPADVVTALKTGPMQAMATGMSQADIEAVAVYLTGQPIDAAFDLSKEASNPCPASDRFSSSGPAWNGWSPDHQNTRVASSTTITAANAPKLKVKWAFAYQGGRYGEPTAFGNRVFVTSGSGMAYGLDKATGCVAWSFKAEAGMRVTASVGKLASAPSGYAVYFGDFNRNVYALDAGSGKQLWKVNVESQPRGVLTGAPTLYNDVLYVPVSSWEETVGNNPVYECCKMRGSVVALNAKTGHQIWKSYTIPKEPAPFKKSATGTQLYGPAGAAVWNSPTIDPKRGVLYIATGDTYTDVKEPYSDGVEAMDLKTGAIKWAKQVTKDDSFLMSCRAGVGNCPTAMGPDHDFGASVILKHLPNGKDLVLAGQKSGQVYAMDPDKQGDIVWQTRIGMGSALGGVEWGMAADDNNLYVAVNSGAEREGQTPGGPGRSLTALKLTDGTKQWQTVAPTDAGVCTFQPNCRPGGYSGPPSLANGVLYGVNQDGHVRAFTAADGKPVWDFDTGAQHYDTVNGVKNQRGGNLDATGMTFAGDMAFLMAGFNGASSKSGPDNVLLAFSVDGK